MKRHLNSRAGQVRRRVRKCVFLTNPGHHDVLSGFKFVTRSAGTDFCTVVVRDMPGVTVPQLMATVLEASRSILFLC